LERVVQAVSSGCTIASLGTEASGILFPHFEALMNVHVSYKVQKTPDLEKEINHQIEKLRKRLQVFRPDLVHLKGILEQNSPREGTHVSLNLRLPSGQLAAQGKAPSPTAAIKSAFDELIQQLTRHKDLLRASHKWRRQKGTSQDSAEPGVPFEETVAAVLPPTISADDIRSYVDVNLSRLERFVDRELYFRHTAEEPPGDGLSTEEVVDEVIAQALSDGERPERLALEPWLYHLAVQAMDEMSARRERACDRLRPRTAYGIQTQSNWRSARCRLNLLGEFP